MSHQPTDPQPPVPAEVPRGAAVRHLILSIALWITYVVYWKVVLSRGVSREAPLSFLILAVFAVFQFLLTQGWIAHNRELASRHAGRRRRYPIVDTAGADADFLGRDLVLPAENDLRHAAHVVVRVEGDRKVFEALPPGSAFWSRNPS
jgi:hypothetical protein